MLTKRIEKRPNLIGGICFKQWLDTTYLKEKVESNPLL